MLGKWKKEFLTYKKFKVIANRTMSDEEDVLSGVLQRKVSAEILFIIISDNEKEVKGTVRWHAYDARVNKMIRSEDKVKMKTYVNKLHKYAENLMKFKGEKFKHKVMEYNSDTLQRYNRKRYWKREKF